MSTADAVRILERAEAELRLLMEQALQDGRYADIAGIAHMADRLSRLLASGAGADADAAVDDAPEEEVVAGEPSGTPPRPGSRLSKGRIRKLFPRFEREGDKLVKIAWSKKSREEYEHKAPREVVDLLIHFIKSKKGVGARFVADDIFPIKDVKRNEIPSYQAYLALAWLVQEGVITKFGREGYLLKPTAVTPEHIAQLWEGLPARD